MPAGYSKRSLVDKLGIEGGDRAAILNPPAGYRSTLGRLPREVSLHRRLASELDFIQFFARSRADLEARFASLKNALAPNGALWVSWPKRTSREQADLTENLVREIGLKFGLVDIKVCAVDETWSALKFVYRLKDRK